MIAIAGKFGTGWGLCLCDGAFFINNRCVSCRGLMQMPTTGVNNTLAGEGFGEMKESCLRLRLQQNADEYDRILAELKKLTDKPPPRENRGLFTKRILEKVERRFPSHPERLHRRQSR